MKIAKQQGFTLIELIAVITILGILAATAMPRFADFSGQAKDAARMGLAGAINSANALNVSYCGAGHNSCVPIAAVPATAAACLSTAKSITDNFDLGSKLTIGYNGTTCTVSDGTKTSTFTISKAVKNVI